MKSLIIALMSILVISFSASAQIQIFKPEPSTTIGKCKSGTAVIAELTYKTDGVKDTTYTLMYENYKYKTISDAQYLEFSNDGGALNSLYDIFKSVFKDENKKNKDYVVTFNLGKEMVAVSTFRVLGVTSLMFQSQKGYVYLTERQVDKLFGRDL